MLLAVAALRVALLAGAIDHVGHSEGSTLDFAFALMDGIGAGVCYGFFGRWWFPGLW